MGKGRPKQIRRISSVPAVSGFRPYGGSSRESEEECVFLLFEEYESLKLNDYEKHTQVESAQIMGVSRPTFTRIYISAREKVAKAFVEGLRIVIEGGKVEIDENWYVCHDCHAVFSSFDQPARVCALCGGADIDLYHNKENITIKQN